MQTAAQKIPRATRHRLVRAEDPPESSSSGRAPTPVSATLAANEALTRKRQAGKPVLPLAFGEAGLPVHLLDRYGMGVLPASAFGEQKHALRLRVATGLLYGDTDAQRELALATPDPLTLPWIAAALDRIEDTLAGLTPRHCAARPA
jgi:hypothetical protein